MSETTTSTPNALAADATEVERAIRTALMVTFEPTRLDVINESHLHAGHRSSPGTGDSHFRVYIVSAAFDGQSRVSRHRALNQALAHLIGTPIHALALDAKSPGEIAPITE